MLISVLMDIMCQRMHFQSIVNLTYCVFKFGVRVISNAQCSDEYATEYLSVNIIISHWNIILYVCLKSHWKI